MDTVSDYVFESASAHAAREYELENPALPPLDEWAVRESNILEKLGL